MLFIFIVKTPRTFSKGTASRRQYKIKSFLFLLLRRRVLCFNKDRLDATILVKTLLPYQSV